MKNINLKKILPHVIAVIIFLIVSIVYCKPALDGKVLKQDDISKWEGAIQNSKEYAAKHDGKYPLWTNGMFSGMPTIQIGGVGGSYIVSFAYMILNAGLPKPANFFFLACLCFYIFCCCIRIIPWVGIFGSLAYAYATYNPIIIAVGHDTKMMAIAYMPAVLAGIWLILDKKYWLGAFIATLFIGLMVSANHLQIFYYLFIGIGVMCSFKAVQFIKQGAIKHLAISAILIAFCTAIGVGTNAKLLMSTYEYQKETQRGGASALTDTSKKQKSKTGLDKDYAFSYSMYKAESLVLMFPRAFGGSSDKQEVEQEKSKAIEAIASMPNEMQQQMPMSFYWGGIGGTSGPPYAGAIVCFLAIVGMFLLDGKDKWWMFTTFVLTLMISWGSYFDGFNTILYNYLPLFNKFRAPSMILVVPQLLLTVMAILTVQKIIDVEDKNALWATFKKAGIGLATIFALAFLAYISFDYMGENNKEILKQVREMNQPQLLDMVKGFTDNLIEDRKGLFLSDIFRTLGFIILAVCLLFLYLKNIIKPILLGLGLALFALIDVSLVNTKYLNTENYIEKEEKQNEFSATPKDNEILADKSDYRVFNIGGNRFAEAATSYLYKSVGGYHSAKIRIYQDLYERQLSNNPNPSVLSMLNVKYIIQKDNKDKTTEYQLTNTAYGSAWFAKHINFVKNADVEMEALNTIVNLKDTAIVQESFKSNINFTAETDTSATISLINNDNDIIEYTATNSKNALAVFSEIYYTAGWKATVDGKEQPIIKVNYALRGLTLAPGKHKIEFNFMPEGYKKGKILGIIAELLLGLLFIACTTIFFLRNKQKTN
jgi:Bacterial membrane protein YfhO